MPRTRYRTETTPTQKTTVKYRSHPTISPQRCGLGVLAKLLGEKGFAIFPLSYGFRQHSRDFMAADKQQPTRFVLVRPIKDTGISVQPFLDPVLYPDVVEVIGMAQKKYSKILWVTDPVKIARRGRKLVSWKSFVPTKILKRERKLLLDPPLYQTPL